MVMKAPNRGIPHEGGKRRQPVITVKKSRTKHIPSETSGEDLSHETSANIQAAEATPKQEATPASAMPITAEKSTELKSTDLAPTVESNQSAGPITLEWSLDNLSSKTDQELREMAEAIQLELNDRHITRRREAIRRIQEIANEANLFIGEISDLPIPMTPSAAPATTATAAPPPAAKKSETTPTATPKPSLSVRTKAVYKNPDDPSKTWSGRGKRPAWLDNLLKSGTKLEDLRVLE